MRIVCVLYIAKRIYRKSGATKCERAATDGMFKEDHWCLSYQSTGDVLCDGVISLVELLHFGSHLGLAILPPG